MKRLSLFIYFFLITVLQATAQQSFDKTAVKSVMKRVADWQIANPNKGAEHDDLDWTHAALYLSLYQNHISIFHFMLLRWFVS